MFGLGNRARSLASSGMRGVTERGCEAWDKITGFGPKGAEAEPLTFVVRSVF